MQQTLAQKSLCEDSPNTFAGTGILCYLSASKKLITDLISNVSMMGLPALPFRRGRGEERDGGGEEEGRGGRGEEERDRGGGKGWGRKGMGERRRTGGGERRRTGGGKTVGGLAV